MLALSAGADPRNLRCAICPFWRCSSLVRRHDPHSSGYDEGQQGTSPVAFGGFDPLPGSRHAICCCMRWFEEPGDPLDFDYRRRWPANTRARWRPGKTCSHAGCAQPDPLRGHAAGARLAPVRLRAELRPGGVPAHAGCSPSTAGRRPVVPHGGHQMSLNMLRGWAGRQRVVPGHFPAVRRLRRRPSDRKRLRPVTGRSRDWLQRKAELIGVMRKVAE